jgi:hypothetical protein
MGCGASGVEVHWNPGVRRVKTREGEAPAEPPNAGPRCEQLRAFLRSSRERCSVRGRDAAQQELRPPGTDRWQKVNAIGSGAWVLCVQSLIINTCDALNQEKSAAVFGRSAGRIAILPPSRCPPTALVRPHCANESQKTSCGVRSMSIGRSSRGSRCHVPCNARNPDSRHHADF